MYFQYLEITFGVEALLSCEEDEAICLVMEMEVGELLVKMQSCEILTIADLPKAGLSRWTAARKSTVLRAVMFGLISTDEAIGRYKLTHNEFQEWLRSYADYGRNGLKVTHKKP